MIEALPAQGSVYSLRVWILQAILRHNGNLPHVEHLR